MSNKLVNYPEGGKSRRRPAERARRGLSLWLLLAVWIGASSAMAAEVVQVRVGKHAKFTRIVFELDRAAGYRIERNESGPGGGELVVSLQASSKARKIQSAKSLISTVEVSPDGTKSVARIKLRQDGLQLKEMILNHPPRIVLDVMAGSPGSESVAKASSAAAAKASKAKAATESAARTAAAQAKATASKTADRADDAANSVIEQAKAARAAAAARIEKTKAAAADKANSLEAKASAAAENTKSAANAAAQSATDAAKGATAAVVDGVDQNIVDPAKDAAKAIDSKMAQAQTNAADAMASAKAKLPVKPPVKKSPMIVSKPSKAKDDGGWMNWALAGAAGLLLVGGGLFVASRRRGDAVDFADEDEDVDRGSALDDVNPFSNLDNSQESPPLIDGQDPLSGSAVEIDDAVGASVGASIEDQDGFALSSNDDDKEQEAVFATDSVEDDMEVISRDDVNESLGMPPTVGGVPEEFMQLMREMQAKVEGLEGRVEELVDARDRLERQVAAQTEELRVQRAAIARTQRAVRNLARPEDDEQEPTEPALRDPNKD